LNVLPPILTSIKKSLGLEKSVLLFKGETNVIWAEEPPISTIPVVG